MFTEILAVASGPHPFWDPARAPVRARHQATTPTATPVYSDSDAGQAVYFQVNTEDSNWSLVPVTGTS
jgi:hypothetical protein